jgi:hypothetical protein
MKQRLAARCDSFARPKASAVWITDDLLNEALRRFTHIHRRCGSNVPGPLEARRREAKRRNGGLARHGPSSSFDHAAIFSKQTGSGWWDSPSQPLPQSESTPFKRDFFQPGWSSAPPPPPPIPHPQSIEPSQSSDALFAFNDSEHLAATDQQIDKQPLIPSTPVAVPDAQASPLTSHDTLLKLDTAPDHAAAGIEIDIFGPGQIPQVPHPLASNLWPIPNALDELDDSRDHTAAVLQSVPHQQTQKPAFKEVLARCLSLRDLRSLIHEHGSMCQVDKATSLLVYDHVISQNWSAQDVAEYLSDPVFHAPGSAIAVRFVRAQTLLDQLKLDHEQWLIVMPALQDSVALGFLSAQEWTELLLEVSTFLARRAKWGELLNSPAVHVEGLLRAFDQCSMLSKDDLDSDLFLRHAASLLSQEFHEENMQLLGLIQRWLDRENHSLVAEALATWAGTGPLTSTAVSSAARALSSLSTAMLVRVLNQTSKILVAAALPAGDKYSSLANLADVLEEVSHLGNGPELRPEDWNVLLSTRSRGSTRLTASECAVINIWVIHHLFAKSRVAEEAYHAINIQKLRARNYHNYLRKLFGHPKEKTAGSTTAKFAIVLHTLPLPGKNMLLEHLGRVTNDPSYAWHKCQLRVKHGLLLSGDLALMADCRTYHFVRKHMYGALTTTCSGLTLDFDTFGALARSLISENPNCTALVARVLQNSHRLLSILRRPRTSAKSGHTRRSSRSVGGHNDIEHEALPRVPLPKIERKALDLVNMLAVTYATSQRLSNTQAVEWVEWCYKFLLQLSAPIEPPISQALWHVNVTRQKHCSPERRRWLLHVVQRVEGAETAHLLNTRPDFANRRAESFQALVRLYDQQVSSQCASKAILERSSIIQQRVQRYKTEAERAFARARARSTPLEKVPEEWETHTEWRKAFQEFFTELGTLPSNSSEPLPASSAKIRANNNSPKAADRGSESLSKGPLLRMSTSTDVSDSNVEGLSNSVVKPGLEIRFVATTKSASTSGLEDRGYLGDLETPQPQIANGEVDVNIWA